MGGGAGSLVGILGMQVNMQLVALGGFGIATALVLATAYLTVRRYRGHLSGHAFRRLYLQNLTRVAAWSVGAYVVWFIFVSPIFSRYGIHIPRPK